MSVTLGSSRRGRVRIADSGLTSLAITRRPQQRGLHRGGAAAAEWIVDDVAFLVSRSMKYAGSCGLKQARYEISWIDEAWRCWLVHNSCSYTGTDSVSLMCKSERL